LQRDDPDAQRTTVGGAAVAAVADAGDYDDEDDETEPHPSSTGLLDDHHSSLLLQLYIPTSYK